MPCLEYKVKGFCRRFSARIGGMPRLPITQAILQALKAVRYGHQSYLTRVRFVAAIRLALSQAGIDVKPYSGHSFQIGVATTVTVWGSGLSKQGAG